MHQPRWSALPGIAPALAFRGVGACTSAEFGEPHRGDCRGGEQGRPVLLAPVMIDDRDAPACTTRRCEGGVRFLDVSEAIQIEVDDIAHTVMGHDLDAAGLRIRRSGASVAAAAWSSTASSPRAPSCRSRSTTRRLRRPSRSLTRTGSWPGRSSTRTSSTTRAGYQRLAHVVWKMAIDTKTLVVSLDGSDMPSVRSRSPRPSPNVSAARLLVSPQYAGPLEPRDGLRGTSRSAQPLPIEIDVLRHDGHLPPWLPSVRSSQRARIASCA